jgi:hypothetical protein
VGRWRAHYELTDQNWLERTKSLTGTMSLLAPWSGSFPCGGLRLVRLRLRSRQSERCRFGIEARGRAKWITVGAPSLQGCAHVGHPHPFFLRGGSTQVHISLGDPAKRKHPVSVVAGDALQGGPHLWEVGHGTAQLLQQVLDPPHITDVLTACSMQQGGGKTGPTRVLGVLPLRGMGAKSTWPHAQSPLRM